MATRITEIQRRFRCDFFAAQAFEHLEAQLAAVTAQRDELLLWVAGASLCVAVALLVLWAVLR